ncbi:MAG: ABC transporter ATP-binding protein/permease [Clostridiales bacterium]|nr:ABC transporter ATP-binding protein [Clostridiales bacterium]MCR5275226.1 ABC transporter ATP-binding protein/permease [Clostridiales bacterium]
MKMMFNASPKFVLFPALDAIRGEVSIFIEHVFLIGFVLEAAEFGYSFRRVGSMVVLIAALITLGMIFTVLAGDYMQEKERPKVREKIKMRLYEKARSVDLACYDDPEFYNSQVMSIAEVDKRIDSTMDFIKSVLSGLTVVTLTGSYFLIKDKVSILFVLASFLLSYFANQVYNKLSFKVRMRRYPPERKREYVKRVFYLKDYAKEIRLDPEVTDVLEERFEKANQEVYEAEKSLARKKFGLAFLKNYLFGDFIGDVLYPSYLMVRCILQKALSLSSMVMLCHRFGDLKRNLRVFTETYPKACETSLYIQKIRDFLAYEPKVVSEGSEVPSAPAKALSLEGVGFSYKKDQPAVLSDINLKVEPGEKIALVGYNGAGKTTLVKLLMRLYDCSEGQILADGVNVRNYDVEAYRDSIGTVFQDFEIFAGTVKENVILDEGSKADEARVKSALKDSGLAKKVDSLPMRWDTPLTHEFSENGVDLSGGEQQKLAISRVFYQNASLMILDEPSSALDPIAEYQLNHAMLEATKDKTVIFISHRLSTTRLADRIFMLEEGRIVEEGSHDSLLARGGKYAEMWKAQAGAYIEV